MKSSFFIAILFCSAISAKAQLPPVRTSNLAGIQTDNAATAVPLRKPDNASTPSSRTSGSSSSAVLVPLRKADSIPGTANLSGANARSASSSSQLPIRSGGPAPANVVAEKVPLRSTDPSASTADQSQQKN